MREKRKKKIMVNFEEGSCGIPLSFILEGELLIAIPLIEREASDPASPPVRQKSARRKRKCLRMPLYLRGHKNYYHCRGRR